MADKLLVFTMTMSQSGGGGGRGRELCSHTQNVVIYLLMGAQWLTFMVL